MPPKKAVSSSSKSKQTKQKLAVDDSGGAKDKLEEEGPSALPTRRLSLIKEPGNTNRTPRLSITGLVHVGRVRSKSISQVRPSDDDLTLNKPVELSTLDEIHKTFDAVIEEFKGDKAAERFLDEYEKLYQALRQSHKDLKAWQLKCHTLANEVKNNTEKVNMAIHLSQEDRSMIASLNKQVSDAWTMVEEMHVREMKAKETVDRMQDEIYVLTGLVEDGMGLDDLQKLSEKAKTEIKGLEHQISTLEEEGSERETKYSNIIDRLKKEIHETQTILKNLSFIKDGLLHRIEEDTQFEEEQAQTIFRLERLKIRLRGEATKLLSDITGWKYKLKKANNKVTEVSKEKDHLQVMFRQERFEKDKIKKSNEELTMNIQKLSSRFVDLQQAHTHMENSMKTNKSMLEMKTKDIKVMEAELTDMTREMNSATRKYQTTQGSLFSCGETLKTELNEKDVVTKLLINAEDESERMMSNLKLTIFSLTNCGKQNKKLECKNKNFEDLLKENDNTNNRLQSDLNNAKNMVRNVLISLKAAISEKERFSKNLNLMLTDLKTLESDYITQEGIGLMQKKVITSLEVDVKTEQTKKVYALNERDALDGLVKKMEMENSDLTTENINMVKQTKTLSITMETIEAHVEQLNEKINQMRKELNMTQNDVIDKKMENKKLRIELGCMELELSKACKQIDVQKNRISQQNINVNSLTCQRNVLGATCVRNNHNIDMLKEKNNVLSDIITTGSKLYERRMQEIKFLHLNNTNIWRQKDTIMRKLQNIDNLKSKLGLANQQLVDFKARVKALEDQPPMSVHKYVHMKAEDMTKYEMLLKTNHLVKKLIDKTDEVTRLEAALVEKAEICNHFKEMLIRAPGPEVALKATVNRKEKEGLTRKLKAALAENNMTEWNAQDRTEERDALKIELAKERGRRMALQRRFNRDTNGTLPDIKISNATIQHKR